MPKPLTYRRLLRSLRDHDSRFEVRGGKGSETILMHPDVNGRPAKLPLPHHGDGDTIAGILLAQIVRTFDLPRGFFDRRDRRKAAAAPAPEPEFVHHRLRPFTHDPLLDFVWCRDGAVDLFIPQHLREGDFVDAVRFGRCLVCNELVQDNGRPCPTCSCPVHASVFDPTIPAPDSSSGGSSGPPGTPQGSGSGSRARKGRNPHGGCHSLFMLG